MQEAHNSLTSARDINGIFVLKSVHYSKSSVAILLPQEFLFRYRTIFRMMRRTMVTIRWP
jgi:hypothetical protein